MKGIIFYKNNSLKGELKLNEVIEEYKECGIELTHKTNSRFEPCAYFSNGDLWQVKPAADSARGYFYNIAYIEDAIDEETVARIIMPGLRHALPYRGFCYYK